MRRHLSALFVGLNLLILPFSIQTSHAADQAAPRMKEWTFLVFLNGHNNLDRYGADNINWMEKVGSTNDVNVVVQWASTKNGTTKRLLVQKDNDPSKVTSPTVEDMGKVDMGDWHNVVEFVKWAHTNYPAKHYFLNVWNHGTGWHKLRINSNSGISPMDISFDDETHNAITTQQLGMALAESAKIVGHKIDIYGSDACLMAMAEVAAEMSDSVSYFVGSEEVEPAAGWPYAEFLKRWTAKPTANGAEVSKMLTEEYIKSYQGGSNGTSEVTFSAFDLSKMEMLNSSMTALGHQIKKLDANNRKKIVAAARSTIYFTYSDYGDLIDFLNNAQRLNVENLESQVFVDVREAVKQFVIANATTKEYANAHGVAFWLPTSTYTFNSHLSKYNTLKFDVATSWSTALQYVLQDNASLN